MVCTLWYKVPSLVIVFRWITLSLVELIAWDMLTTPGLQNIYLEMSTLSHAISLLVKWRQMEKCRSSRWLRAATQRMLSWVFIAFQNYPKVVYKALRIGYSTLVYSLHSVQSLHCTNNITPSVPPYSRGHRSTLLHHATQGRTYYSWGYRTSSS